MKYALVLLAVLAGCSGDDPAPIDSPLAIDSPSGTVDAPTSNICTGQLYDRCTSNAQCMSGMCRMFNNLGVMLCTQVCSPTGTACPPQGTTVVMCSTGGSAVCRPAMANACTLP